MRWFDCRSLVIVATFLGVLGVNESAVLAGTGTIQGTINCDTDHSGTLTAGDAPLNGVTVRISGAGVTEAEATTPDTTPGHYSTGVVWVGPAPASMTVEVVNGVPAGATFVFPSGGQTTISISDGGGDVVDFLLDCLDTLTDTFNCYKVADLGNPRFVQRPGVVLADQLGTRTVDVKKPDMLCVPASQDGSTITDPATHVCCYKVKTPRLTAPIQAEVTDLYGSLQLKVKKSALLCQPCSKTLLP